MKLSNQGITNAGVLVGFLLVVAVIFGGWYAYQNLFAKDSNDETAQVQGESITSESSVTYSGQNGKSALELLLETNTTVQVQDSPYGKYVSSINNIEGGTENKYWIFYINGEMAQVGAGEYQTTDSDIIEWKFE